VGHNPKELTMMIRQGDLALIPVPAPSSSTTPKPKSNPKVLTLAIGEDSGHMHQITGEMVGDVLIVDQPSELVIGPQTAAWRHTPIQIERGAYRPVVQREYTPEGARQIGD
jgi:hypothetical protein